MNDRLAALRLFVRVARAGSFSAAGRALGLSQPTASRVIAALEREVGAALLTRTTRAVTLTEAGADYLERIEPLLAALEEADHAARGTGELRGVLRVGVSSSFAVREVIPRLPDFLAPHPALKVDLLMDDQRQDLVGEGVDLALRFGTLTDSTATYRVLTVAQRGLFAAPAYLARAGTPQTPAALSGHRLIVGPSGRGAWTFARDGRRVSIRPEPWITATVNEGSTAAAVAGMGIVHTSVWGCRAEVERGDLVPVLADWDMGAADISAVFAAGRAAKPAARAFADYLALAFRGL
jgi:DNA-binding transcriptional LysR family regulator